MALSKAAQVVGIDIDDGALIDLACCDVTGGDEVAKPLCCIGGNLVVVGRHAWRFRFGVVISRATHGAMVPGGDWSHAKNSAIWR